MTDTNSAASFDLPATAGIGRVALQVGLLDCVLPFYRDAVGFEVKRRLDGDDDGGERAHLGSIRQQRAF